MRRLCAISAAFLVLATLLFGCHRQPAKNNDDDKKSVALDPNLKVEPGKTDIVGKKPSDEVPPKVASKPPDVKQEQYEAAVSDALTAMAARHWDDALTKFESAQKLDNNDFVKSQIADLKGRIERDSAAKTTTKDIETVLNDGKAEDAAKLAADALKELGDGDDAEKLIALRLQAEAIRAAEKAEKDDARHARFRKEGELALEEKNLRAAALAFEQALLVRDDADLKKAYDGVRAKLDQYDALRKQAKELRADPLRQADALAALNEAKKAWDTLQIRQEIDDCTLALAKRRDTVSVVDFEVRNDVGLPNAGAVLADELFPLMQPKYDLVERGQLKKVLAELNMQAGIPDDPKQQRKVGKLANVRYLVVGSVYRLVGVSIKARLIDVETGLVVQTGKIVAPTMDEALDQMKDLAKQLMSGDEAALKAEGDKVGEEPKVVAADAVLPPPPAAPDAKAPPPAPPPQLVNVRAPDFGGVKVDVFAKFGPAPAGVVAPPPDAFAVAQRNRLLYAAVEMGDFLFQAGRFREARRQYEFALQLAPDSFDVRARLERVALLAPPEIPALVVRPRLAVLPFMTMGKPSVVPPSLRLWTPNNLAPYFTWYGYDVVDTGELYWYMGRMGISMNDLMVNPVARRWLARAVGVRYFVFGNCVETGSFDVNTYLIDAELGYMQGGATINVQNWYELKLRMPELAQVTMMSPAERAAYMAQQQRVEFFRLMNLGQWHMDRKEYRKAADDFARALQIYPDNIQAQVNLFNASALARNQEVERDRWRQWEALKAANAEARRRQILMTQTAEVARKQAIVEATARTPAQQTLHVNLRFNARAKLVAQAQVALQTNNFGVSVSLFQSAANFTPVTDQPLPPIDYQAFALARHKAEKAEQLRATQFALARETGLREARDKELAATKLALVAEKIRADKEHDRIRAAQVERDLEIYKAGIRKGQELMAKKQFDDALAAFQSAQRVAHEAKHTAEVNNYINIVVQQRAEKTDAKLADKLAAESERRKLLEIKAKENDTRYQSALTAAQTALAAKNLDAAEAKFQEAGQIFKTDAVLIGLKQVGSARADLLAVQQKGDAEKKRAAAIVQLIADGKTALDGKKYGDAIKSFREAKRLAPDNLDAIAGLTQAEQGYAKDATVKVGPKDSTKDTKDTKAAKLQELITAGQAALKAKNYDAAEKALRSARELDPTNTMVAQGFKDVDAGRKALTDGQKSADFQTAFKAGEKSLTAKDYKAALASFQQALKLVPDDAKASAYAKQAQAGIDGQAKTALAFQTAMDAGEKAMAQKKYDAAVKAFTDATKLDPGDARAGALLTQARQALGDAQAQANYQKAMTTGTTALSAKKYDDAVKAYNLALKYMPNDQKATQQLVTAQKEWENAKKAPPPPDPAKAFSEAMDRGAAAEKKMKYSDAVKAFTEAVNMRPKDQNAHAGLNRNQYNVNMQQGQQYLDNMMWLDAQREFEAALKLFPKDATAQKQLQKAKNKGK